MQKRDSFNIYMQDAIRDNWELLALTDFNGISLQYRDIARKVAKLHILYEHAGVKKGDRIALCGKNSAQWCVAFISIMAYGAVAVPILPDFHSDSIHHLVNHSNAKLLFCDGEIWDRLNEAKMNELHAAFLIHDFSPIVSRDKEIDRTRTHLNELFGKKYPERFSREDVVFHVDQPDELAIINYTSGSTGFSKGVMIPFRAIWSNLQFCFDNIPYLKAGDGVVCMLPLAHTYGMSIDLFQCLGRGCHLYFLTRLPSPSIILKAFAEVRPKLIVAVPLILEKIVRNRIFPMLEKPMMKLLMRVPFLDAKLYARINENILQAFGGQLQELIIGGAALNKDVEAFLTKIKFPVTVGYGMTECAPLISYSNTSQHRVGSCGKIVDRMEARIESPDPARVPGVLKVRGANVMLGYYKNKEATAACMQDGWLDTGDICTMDADGHLYIKGRNKNMILGPSGQNIYPEEIEQVLNSLPYVSESLIVARDGGQLVGLVHADADAIEEDKLSAKALEEVMAQNLKQLNADIPAYARVHRIELMDKEFEKTPKRSIKRYLYQEQA
ncbi:MAG: AMP-binding protein [Clostridium sp.]|nr:AMP-binding protein [Clostridium sp.]